MKTETAEIFKTIYKNMLDGRMQEAPACEGTEYEKTCLRQAFVEGSMIFWAAMLALDELPENVELPKEDTNQIGEDLTNFINQLHADLIQQRELYE